VCRGSDGRNGAGCKPSSIGRGSPLGLFLRQFLLALNSGSFPALSRLYDGLLEHVDEAFEGTLRDTAEALPVDGL